MGALVTTLHDIRTVVKDLKITLNLAAKIILKVHTIVEDFEETVQELKRAVKCVSTRTPFQEKVVCKSQLNRLVDRVEVTAEYLKSTVVDTVNQVDTKELFRGTQEKWEKVVDYSRESTRAVTELIALSNSLQELADRPLAKAVEMHSPPVEYPGAGSYKSLEFLEVNTTERSLPESMLLNAGESVLDNVLETLDFVAISLPNEVRPFLCLGNGCVLNLTGPTQKLPSSSKETSKSATVLRGSTVTGEDDSVTRDQLLKKYETTRTQIRRATPQIPAEDVLYLFLILDEMFLLEGTNGEWKSKYIHGRNRSKLSNQVEIIELDN